MWFHFCTVNHNTIGRSTLTDMAAWFEAGLLDLGHRVTSSEHSVEPAAINLFWECFNPAMVHLIRQTGVTYGLIATEIPDGQAFNWRSEPEWQQRFDCFHDAARGASFIWSMVEQSVPFYAQFCEASFMELGFSERLIPAYIDAEPEFDFSFFGLPTPHRQQLVESLSRYARIEWPRTFLAPRQVGELIGKTRVGLNFKQSAEWPVPSPTRLGRFLMAQRDVACEWVPVNTRQGEIISPCPPERDFPDFCLDRLHSDWRGRALQAFEAYRTRMPMRRILEPILDRSCRHIELPATGRQAVRIKLPPPPELIKSIQQWNIVEYAQGFYALKQEIGPIEVGAEFANLRAIFGDSIQWAPTLERLEEILAQLERSPEPAEQTSPIGSSSEQAGIPGRP